MNLVKYAPIGKLSLRSKAKKFIFWQLVILSVLTNLLLAHQIFNVRCRVNGEVTGWFVKATTCEALAEDRADSLELSRQKFVAENQDLFANDK